MNIVLNNAVVNGTNGQTIGLIEKEVDILRDGISSAFISNILKNSITIPVFRLYLLNEDETIKLDVSEDLVSGSLTKTYQTGCRCSLNITLINKNGKWHPSPINGLIYIGTKFRLDAGFIFKNTVYWKRQGIFVVKEPQLSSDSSKQTVDFELCDKFGLLDGTIYGNSALKTIIPQGINMEQAFYTALTTDRGNGIVYDNKHITFDEKYKNIVTYYDIEQGYNENIGDILIELGQSISCDVYYDEFGHLMVQGGCDDYAANVFPVVYNFDENGRDIVTATLKKNWSKIRNSITVKGAIVNGYQYTATIKNTKASSPLNIMLCGELAEVIEDDKIYSDILCTDRAMYELIQYTRGINSVSLTCNYIPHLDVNQMVHINYDSLGIKDSTYIIDKFTLNISSNPQVTVELSNPREAGF